MNTKEYLMIAKNYKITTLIKLVFGEIHRKIWRELVVGSYAQNYEDLTINKLLNNKKRGNYLEIGAYHPTRLSNTYYFYKRGWRGTVVEPNPNIKSTFERIRPKDNFINKGVADKNGLMKYYEFVIPALNTFSKKEADKNKKNGHRLNKISEIKIVDIEELLKKIDKVDFLSIDTEGFDKLILKNWPWEKIKPKVICVETDKNRVDKLLVSNSYKVAFRNKYNSIFVSEKSGSGDGRKR
jgi:FkbM family methyltransferase